MPSFSNIFSKVFSKGRNMYGQITPAFHWTMFLILFAIGFLVVLLWHGYLYMKISGGSFVEGVSENARIAETLDREKLASLIEYYKTKSRNFADLEKNRPKTVDPSL